MAATTVLVHFPAGFSRHSTDPKQAAAIPIDPSSTVRVVLAEVLAQCGSQVVPDKSWGLYYLPDNNDQSTRIWLNNLDDIIPELSDLYYANRIRTIQVTDLDGFIKKTVNVDETQTVSVLTSLIANRFGIEDSSEFSLQKYKQFSNSQLEWLRPNSPFYKEVTAASQILIFRKKYFLFDQMVTTDSPALLHFSFLEARYGILSGVHDITFEQAVQFAGLNMQIRYGNYDPLVHVAGFVDVMEFLPAQDRATPFIEEYIYREHRRLRNIEESTAKLRFLRRCSQLPTYGGSFAEAKEQCGDDGFCSDILIGANSNCVLILNRITKQVIGRNLLVEVNGIDITERCLTLKLKGRVREFVFESIPDAELFYDLITGYMAFQRTIREQTNLATFAAKASLIIPRSASIGDLRY
uniref:FERM domain-containing protein n=1 Tax=Spongospora subterranea TaxID=70186 RepID=A0A0H5R8S6_9EUKA|eukprot:CRZ10520.1 hypothetical protein [Spongospora subterranea]